MEEILKTTQTPEEIAPAPIPSKPPLIFVQHIILNYSRTKRTKSLDTFTAEKNTNFFLSQNAVRSKAQEYSLCMSRWRVWELRSPTASVKGPLSVCYLSPTSKGSILEGTSRTFHRWPFYCRRSDSSDALIELFIQIDLCLGHCSRWSKTWYQNN